MNNLRVGQKNARTNRGTRTSLKSITTVKFLAPRTFIVPENDKKWHPFGRPRYFSKKGKVDFKRPVWPGMTRYEKAPFEGVFIVHSPVKSIHTRKK